MNHLVINDEFGVSPESHQRRIYPNNVFVILEQRSCRGYPTGLVIDGDAIDGKRTVEVLAIEV
jgi:hypothetical protein